MPTVMTKYKYNNNLFLVYNTNLLNNNFSADELQQLSRDIQTDYIIILTVVKSIFIMHKVKKFPLMQIWIKSLYIIKLKM